MSLTTRTLRLGAIALTAMSLAGVSACSISLGGSQPEAAATQEASPSPEAPTTAPETTQAPAPTSEPASEPASDQATAQASQPVVAGSSSGERPGADVTITDEDWLTTQEYVDKTISAGTGTVLISENNGYIQIDGDVTTLTITGANNDVFVDYADTVVIEGGNTTVYVRDVRTVVFHGANGEVVWAGDTPVINDFGSNTTTRRQGQGG